MSLKNLILPTSETESRASAEIAVGARPRIDYLDLQARLNADLIDFAVYRAWPQRWMRKPDRALRMAWGQALYVIRHWCDYDTVLSLGEDVAIPLALLLRLRKLRPIHLVIAHNIVSPAKAPLVRMMRVMKEFDRIIVLSNADIHQVVQTYGVPSDRVVFLRDAVDEAYWRPSPGNTSSQPPDSRLILSVGQAKRDYPTLIQSVQGLSCRLHIQAGSQWMNAERANHRRALPANVTVGGYLSFNRLRELYAQAAFVVIALRQGAHHSAGSVSVKEAMAMGKAVIVASDGGLEDYVRHGENGLLTPAADPAVLARSIRLLLDNPGYAAYLGRNGRRLIEQQMSYAAKIDRLVDFATETSSIDHR